MDTRAEFGTAKATVTVGAIVSTAPVVSVPCVYVEPIMAILPALVSVTSISGHSISAVAPDHSFFREVGVRAIAA